MSDDCLFCKLIRGEIPAKMVFEDDRICAFHDISQIAPTHILVIPKKHITTIACVEAEDADLMGHLILKANQIAEKQGLKENGFRYVINTGRDGGQSVFHMHLHILGCRKLNWPPG